LIYSGSIVNISLKAVRAQKKKALFWSLIFTLILGVCFLCLQATEYVFATFNISDSVFGSIFYLTTGAHGLHVFAGVILLFVCLVRAYYSHLRADHHNGLITAVIY
jgi:heme/copper-type cytochrome/quinol oxidase subunit 3